jgi:hypothetical protein
VTRRAGRRLATRLATASAIIDAPRSQIGSRRIVTRFIIGARKEETRLARIRKVADLSAQQKRLI